MDKLTVGVIGAGRVGTALGAALRAAGHEVGPGQRPDADLLLLTVPDDALPAVVADLAGAGRHPGQVVAHTSGAHGLRVLDPAAAAGARPLALHPAMTFTGDATDVERLPGISYGVTAPEDLRPFATRLVADLGGTVEWIAEPDRPLYHAALAHGANHLVTLVNEATDQLRGAGVGQPERLLGPLLRAALENSLRLGDRALTGPVVRGDAGTVTGHLAALGRAAPDSLPAYRALAGRTADRAAAAGRLGPPAAATIKAALAVDTALTAAPHPPPGPHRSLRGMTTGAAPAVLRTRAELAAARAAAASPVAVVMTMGALHEGHAALLRAARERAATVLATIFVNPLQFGPDEDLDRYPRTFDADLALCRAEGVDLVFAPARDEIYPEGEPAVTVDPGPLGRVLEGASRPGHFAGVLTVVLKLLHLTDPQLAYFGEKDYQQLALTRAMVHDLDLAVEVVGVPTVREPDGLARSSRNRYLTPAGREAARSLSAALRAGAAAAAGGAAPAAVLDAAAAEFTRAGGEAGTGDGDGGMKLDYLALTDPGLRPLTAPIGTAAGPAVPLPAGGAARLLVAAFAGGTRLIDNEEILLRTPRGGP